MMKRYFLLLALGLSTCMASAQLIKQGDQLAKNNLIWIGIIAHLKKMECMVRKLIKHTSF